MTDKDSIYSRTCLERPPNWTHKCGLSRQVVFGDRFNYISDRNNWAFKTGGLSWQWSLKTGFTVCLHCIYYDSVVIIVNLLSSAPLCFR